MSTVVQCDDGSYINADLAYKWTIDEDVTRRDECFTIKAHFAGPQHPVPICTRETIESARSVLKAILELACHVIPGGRSAGGEPAERDSAGVPTHYHRMYSYDDRHR